MVSILKNSSKFFSQFFEGSNISSDNGVHFVNGRSLKGPFDTNLKKIILGMGCFWGVEKIFWDIPGVHITAVGYSGGVTKNPTYEQVCTGQTGHNEVVLIYYNPKNVELITLLNLFWEGHDPTQGMRQGNDIGTQYRSGIYTFTNEDLDLAKKSKELYNNKLLKHGFKSITTEVLRASEFFYAEDYHQQYLAKNPSGYCGLGGTGVKFNDAT